ncbi:hypothetical protein [Thauera linaloolentis]|uniref:Uncharacterized protein n=1 Tax=Thauera linaloolentis (strain DSM 12138 / JCM 21573 / CCUG 41526 / CIP 105981 / IAM 15112 / NBRC 102519 / 47Lol) TaxID=1123367 RepID=N6Z6S4_THAL4|nr:hypothetical protein [Thauera linaloolentis]ENO90252.1 hypothetical protein C666_02270 [Thauera linaloolentis 47Lol = DSM 12138]MCM8566257.1 RICIN domain-containing protein [Thauera linaloolentis]
MTLRTCFILCLGLASIAPGHAQTPSPPGHLKLIDTLDRPEDGYCLDIVGSGPYIRFDLPATAHNCKPGLYADEAVIVDSSGYIRFPAYDNKCLTAAGLNGRALPGAGLVVRNCGERSPFLEAQALQVFHLKDSGQVELNRSGLCLTVGPESASTFDETHRWRSLYLDVCANADPSRSRWHFSVPPS